MNSSPLAPRATTIGEFTVTVDPGSSVPPYEQLRVQVIDAVAAGTVAPGAKLPTVRGLADALGIAPNTVARSYRELERDAVIETRGRAGTFIAASGDATTRQAQEAAAAFAARIRQLRLDPAEAVELVRAALR
ncbi:GntR family transcriptional regulator [Lacisediminihabitans sp. FW035]